MSKKFRPTHVQRMREGRAFKLAARGEIIPVRRAASSKAA